MKISHVEMILVKAPAWNCYRGHIRHIVRSKLIQITKHNLILFHNYNYEFAVRKMANLLMVTVPSAFAGIMQGQTACDVGPVDVRVVSITSFVHQLIPVTLAK